VEAGKNWLNGLSFSADDNSRPQRGVSGAEGAAGQRQDAAKLMRVLARVVRMRAWLNTSRVGLARGGCVGVAREGCTDWIGFSSVGQVRQAVQIAGAAAPRGGSGVRQNGRTRSV
jgi:hypothetical protein